jgi:hypothetical protein
MGLIFVLGTNLGLFLRLILHYNCSVQNKQRSKCVITKKLLFVEVYRGVYMYEHNLIVMLLDNDKVSAMISKRIR